MAITRVSIKDVVRYAGTDLDDDSALVIFAKGLTGETWSQGMGFGELKISWLSELLCGGLMVVGGLYLLYSRDSLLFSWAEEAGPRTAEIIRVGKSHMPTTDQLADIIDRDEPWNIVVKRKGGASKPLSASLDLIVRTLDFIHFERRDIVEHCLKTIIGYREPDEVFLFCTTGTALHPDSVTSVGHRAFRQPGIENANIHRLRARYAVRTIETLIDAVFHGDKVGPASSWIETILIKTAEVMGHTNPQSLRPYLTYVLNRRIQMADATKAEKLDVRLRQLRLHEGTLLWRLELQKVASLLQAGRDSEAALVLRKVADETG